MFGTWLAIGLLIVALIYLSVIVHKLYKDVDRLSNNPINQYSLDRFVDSRLKYYELIVQDRTGWDRSALHNYATKEELDILIADLGYERLVEPARKKQVTFVKKSRIN